MIILWVRDNLRLLIHVQLCGAIILYFNASGIDHRR